MYLVGGMRYYIIYSSFLLRILFKYDTLYAPLLSFTLCTQSLCVIFEMHALVLLIFFPMLRVQGVYFFRRITHI